MHRECVGGSARLMLSEDSVSLWQFCIGEKTVVHKSPCNVNRLQRNVLFKCMHLMVQN